MWIKTIPIPPRSIPELTVVVVVFRCCKLCGAREKGFFLRSPLRPQFLTVGTLNRPAGLREGIFWKEKGARPSSPASLQCQGLEGPLLPSQRMRKIRANRWGDSFAYFASRHLRRGGEEPGAELASPLLFPRRLSPFFSAFSSVKLRETFLHPPTQPASFFCAKAPTPFAFPCFGPRTGRVSEPCVDRRSLQPCVSGATASSRFAESRLARTSGPQVSPRAARLPWRREAETLRGSASAVEEK